MTQQPTTREAAVCTVDGCTWWTSNPTGLCQEHNLLAAFPSGPVRNVDDGVAHGWPLCDDCGRSGREVCPQCWLPICKTEYDSLRPRCADPTHDREVVVCLTHYLDRLHAAVDRSAEQPTREAPERCLCGHDQADHFALGSGPLLCYQRACGCRSWRLA